jgi:hypothetical protein
MSAPPLPVRVAPQTSLAHVDLNVLKSILAGFVDNSDAAKMVSVSREMAQIYGSRASTMKRGEASMNFFIQMIGAMRNDAQRALPWEPYIAIFEALRVKIGKHDLYFFLGNTRLFPTEAGSDDNVKAIVRSMPWIRTLFESSFRAWHDVPVLIELQAIHGMDLPDYVPFVLSSSDAIQRIKEKRLPHQGRENFNGKPKWLHIAIRASNDLYDEFQSKKHGSAVRRRTDGRSRLDFFEMIAPSASVEDEKAMLAYTWSTTVKVWEAHRAEAEAEAAAANGASVGRKDDALVPPPRIGRWASLHLPVPANLKDNTRI